MANLLGEEFRSAFSKALIRREDDFSVQYSLPGNPRFWFRVALPLTRPVVVTDFFLGDLDESTGAVALQAVLHDLQVENLGSIEFARLGPAGVEQTAENVARIGRVIDAYVLLRRRFVRLRKVSVHNGDANLRIMFWDSFGPDDPERG